MSGIAQIFLRRGVKVSGSDLKESRVTRELKNLGAEVFIGHRAQNLGEATQVIYSSAVKEDNPEFKEAKKRKLLLIKRARALAELMQDKTVITVTGSHGKTTTTSLASCLLLEAGLSPTVAVGGVLRNIGNNACFGEGKFFVAEADESDGSFLYYQPDYSIITNIDREHLDYYKDFKNVLAAYRCFINQTRNQGCLFACADDVNLKNILKDYKKRYVLFGLNELAHIYPKNIEINGLNSRFDCVYRDKIICRFALSLGGLHNISNALSVVALGLELGIDLAIIQKTLEHYQGAGRRLEVKLDNNKCLVIDDYAHHPTEIKASLAALKHLKPGRIVAIFQPHRYTRTQLLLDEFGSCFEAADYVVITDIYPAGEPPIKGVNAGNICAKIKERFPHKPVHYLPKEKIVEHVLKILYPQDLVVTLGAGDIVKLSDELANILKGQG